MALGVTLEFKGPLRVYTTYLRLLLKVMKANRI
jgi:hypothetical protein